MKLVFALLLLVAAPAWCDNYIVSFKPTMLQQDLFSRIDQLNQTVMKKVQDFNFMVANPMDSVLQVKFAYKAIKSFSANLTPEQLIILRQLPLQITQVGTK